jgi:hypothetical protein
MYLTDMLIDWLRGLPRDVRFAVEGRLHMRGPVWLFQNTSTEDDESVVKALQAVDADVQVLDVAEAITTILDQPIDTDDPKRWDDAKRRWEAIRGMVTYDREIQRNVYVLRGVEYRILPSIRVAARTVYDVVRVHDGMVVASFDFFEHPDGRREGPFLPGGSSTPNSLGQDDVRQLCDRWQAMQTKPGSSAGRSSDDVANDLPKLADEC